MLTDLFVAQTHAIRILVDELLELVQLPRWRPDSFVRHCVCVKRNAVRIVAFAKKGTGQRGFTWESRDSPESYWQLFPTGTSHQLGST